MMTNGIRQMVKQLPRALREHGLFPNPIVIDGPTTEPVVMINGNPVIQFCTGNYLGLGTHIDAKEIAIHSIEKYGLTSSGSRLVSGTQEPQLYLEDTIARFQGVESSVVYFLVTVANMGIINGFMNPPLPRLLSELSIEPVHDGKEIFFDWLSHPSVIDACRLAVGRENMTPYHHADMEDLESKIMKSKAKVKLIATDGLFSTDGDLALLPDIVALSYQYNAMVFVDDAHGSGVLGDNGRGIWEHYHLENEVDFKIGSLAKAFSGGLGAFIIGDREFTDYVRVMGGHYIFGGSIPPAIALAIAQNIETAMNEPWRRQNVLGNAEYLRAKLNEEGFDTLGSTTQIVPILIGTDEGAMTISQKLLDQGFFVPAFRYPAVPHNKARLRMTLMATHAREQIDQFIEIFCKIANEYHIPEALSLVH